ncbi:DUF4403 family protein [Flavobacterium sp. NRK F10]|uniref:DUF4403 family protein n=1 Tax=Flavobacterium sp. NRK F10 TaxID=2954931 RepID=UPI002091826B|nr:DUF4403 family protein [Flavobacterium sp. NRK F10]MCO6175164.1 DUF4403 family protein [Flavobacterium sp. NRK F10]
MKPFFIFALLSILIVLCLTACSSASPKIEAIKPLPSDNTPMVYTNKTSFISLPVEITLKDIEKQLNKNLKGLIYNDSILKDDNCELKIWKSDPITLEEENGVILSKLPLKIWTRIKYGTDFLGLNDTREIYLDGVLTLKSKAHLTNWKLTTTSAIDDFEWNESPAIVIAGKKIPITYIINPTLSYFKKTIAQQIDKAIDETCDFKPHVFDALDKISEPFLVHEAYETWFTVIPVELYVTEARLKDKQITLDMGLKCNLQTMIGQKPMKQFDRNSVILKPVSKMPDKVSLALAGVSTYESASKVLTKNFKGQEFSSGKRKVVVQKVNLWEKDNKLIISLSLTGSINGDIYLTGYPSYNPATQEIYFDQLDYILSTKSVLLKSANWLAQSTILRKIQENCRYSIKENLEEGKQNLSPYLNNYSPMSGIYVNGNLNDFEFEKIELTNKAIIAFLSTTGKIRIKIDGLD